MHEEIREDAPELLGDDGGISQPPPCAVTPVDLLHLEGRGGLGARASQRVRLWRRVSGCLEWRVMRGEWECRVWVFGAPKLGLMNVEGGESVSLNFHLVKEKTKNRNRICRIEF